MKMYYAQPKPELRRKVIVICDQKILNVLLKLDIRMHFQSHIERYF